MPPPILIHYQSRMDGDDPSKWYLRPLYANPSKERPRIEFEIGHEKRMFRMQIGLVQWNIVTEPTGDELLQILADSLGVLVANVRIHPFDPNKPKPSYIN